MTTAEMVAIGAAAFNAVVVPIFAAAARGFIKRLADESSNKVREDLAAHQEHDDQRFEAVIGKLDKIDEKRQEQHAENQRAQGTMMAGIEYLKATILQLPHG